MQLFLSSGAEAVANTNAIRTMSWCWLIFASFLGFEVNRAEQDRVFIDVMFSSSEEQAMACLNSTFISNREATLWHDLLATS